MKLKRTIAISILGALMAGQALPSHAARMLCSMPKPAAGEACGACDPTAPASAEFVARGCCRIAPAEETVATPMLVSPSRRAGISEDRSDAVASVALPPANLLPLVASSSRPAPVFLSASPPLVSRSPILRN